MRISKKRKCGECEKHLVCSIYKGVQSHISAGNSLGLLATYDGDANILSHEIYNALANACKGFTQINWDEYWAIRK